MMIEFPDPEERRKRLRQLLGIDLDAWVQLGECEKVYAISDEDLSRQDEEKTSSVHFLRFELSPAMIDAAKQGSAVHVGVSHKNYRAAVQLEEESRLALLRDLD